LCLCQQWKNDTLYSDSKTTKTHDKQAHELDAITPAAYSVPYPLRESSSSMLFFNVLIGKSVAGHELIDATDRRILHRHSLGRESKFIMQMSGA